ncbi:di-N-acetylchitobiase-like [Tiliqua scincoides]|uniref:di-N-acetylchitobiase-like n=1 Tax=Tiliqua scincoides TaxID=71010 RepID=UPI00346315BB
MQGLPGGGGARFWLALLLLLQPRVGSGACPCQDPSLCNPISGSRDFEVFVFDLGGKNWMFYDWSQITTVAAFGKYDPELMCHAHSKGSRVVMKGNTSVKKIVKSAVRAAWISQQMKLAKEQYMDGININIEEEVSKDSDEYFALTALVKETTGVFHKEIPGSQVTFDVPWSPECIDSKCYNYSGIADSCDFLFVMSYDEPSQLWSKCTVTGTAPYNQTLTGYDDYLHLGISPKKLVMGVPWYGYDYLCLYFSEGHICHFANVPFRGAQCRFSAGHQIPYRIIMARAIHSISGIQWDEEQGVPHFEYKDPQGTIHQVWFDDPRSISLKATYVKERGLRGIGMWNGNCLDYSGRPIAHEQSKAMWKALKPL